MKILLTADPELPVPPVLYGGIERIIDNLINKYVQKGHEVILFANKESKVPCKLIPWKGTKSQNKKDILKNTWQLTNYVYKNKIDVLHSFSRLAYLTAILPLKLPVLMSYQREPSLKQILKAKRLSFGSKFIVTGCSNYITDQFRNSVEGYTVYNCVPEDQFKLKEIIDTNAPLVFLGRIEEIKGTHVAIEVAQRTGRRLVIAGNIPADQQQYFNEKVKPHLNEQITYIGPVNDFQKNDLLQNAFAFLMPILWDEPFGIVMAEAMACGTPVLGFGRGSVPEVVVNGVSGFICNSTDEMIKRLDDVAAINRKGVRTYFEEHFSSTVIADEYLRLYSKILV